MHSLVVVRSGELARLSTSLCQDDLWTSVSYVVFGVVSLNGQHVCTVRQTDRKIDRQANRQTPKAAWLECACKRLVHTCACLSACFACFIIAPYPYPSFSVSLSMLQQEGMYWKLVTSFLSLAESKMKSVSTKLCACLLGDWCWRFMNALDFNETLAACVSVCLCVACGEDGRLFKMEASIHHLR